MEEKVKFSVISPVLTFEAIPFLSCNTFSTKISCLKSGLNHMLEIPNCRNLLLDAVINENVIAACR